MAKCKKQDKKKINKVFIFSDFWLVLNQFVFPVNVFGVRVVLAFGLVVSYPLQRYSQSLAKNLGWSVLQKQLWLKPVNFFHKTFDLRCLTGF